MSAKLSPGHENDIAIVGMAAHLPGARTTDEYWANLRSGVESIRTLDEDELLRAGVSKAALRKGNYVRRAAVLDEMEHFDGEFFGFSPKESAILDPQHRHFFECAWEALESAGHPPERFEGRIGVFASCGPSSYYYLNVCTNPDLVESVGHFLLRHTGNDKDFLATRVSYLLNLTGPSVTVQTACSSSLVAIHQACQSLLNGECDMALAGGVTIEIPHRRGYLHQPGEILSPDGHCHAFDHRAEGTVFGSGAGVVVLRRLVDALADRDPIVAVVRGSAVNNDGARKVGYLAPSVEGQAEAMVEAYELAGIAPDTLGYVECHGTGTYLGDPIEVAALTQAFRKGTERKGFCRIGSVKTNIGHLDTAAGVASFIKAALAVREGEIPPSLHFEKPNPTIDFANSPFVVNDTLYPWKRGAEPRRAAVNSLGVGGTNAHVVLEEPPPRTSTKESERRYELLALSAKSRPALDAACDRLAAYLAERPDVPLADVAFTLEHGRRAFDKRRVVAVRDRDEAIRLLESKEPRRVFTHTAIEGDASAVFMFPGGGSHYPGMGLELYEIEPVFREHLDRGLRLLESRTGVDYRPLFFGDPAEADRIASDFEPMARQVPAIFILEYALAKLWMSKGVEPAALIGHSLGENAAACVASVLSYEDALGLVLLRGQLFDRLSEGAMISVELPPDELRRHLGSELDFAAHNAPSLSVASGPREAIEALERTLAARGIESQRLAIPVAAHSRLLGPILDDFRTYLERIALHPPKIPIASNRTGTWLTDAQATSPAYWVEHLRYEIRFTEGVSTLLQKNGRVLIEVGPGRALSSFARQHDRATPTLNVIPSLRHKDEDIADGAFFLTSLGRAWASGLTPDLAARFDDEERTKVALPSYPFQRQRYFIEPGTSLSPNENEDELGKLPRMEDWGSRPVWKPSPLPRSAKEKAPSTWLLFMDDAGIGRRISERLIRRGHTVVHVHPGDAYRQRSELEYTISPERGREGYDTLVRDLVASGKVPDRIVHLWLLTADESFRPGSSFFHRNLERGFYSLFFLAQALGDESVPRPIHLTVVSNGMQKVADESLPYPEKATVLGPCKVIPRELPGITCAAIDVSFSRSRKPSLRSLWEGLPMLGSRETSTLEMLSDALERELLADVSIGVFALRGNERYEQAYEPLAIEAPSTATRLRERGVYLVTGGLGGIGLTIAEELARTHEARLVLVGRTALPPRSEWERWRGAPGADSDIGRRIARILAIEAAGGEVLPLAADVSNLEQMRGVLEAAHARFGALNGCFHAAGLIRDDLIPMKTLGDIELVFTPKIHGTQVLDELLAQEPLDFFVVFSSTSTASAPAGQIDYVAANAFLEAFAERGDRAYPTIAVQWGIWNETGMAFEALAKRSRTPEKSAPIRTPSTHPLFDFRIDDERNERSLVARYASTTHWVLNEHRTKAGHAVLPGTGYIELARASVAEYEGRRPLELRDLFFLRPLHVMDDAAKDVRVRLRRSQEGYDWEVRSRTEIDGRAGWEIHAQASIALHPMEAPPRAPIAEIEARCERLMTADGPSGLTSSQERHLQFGPRWRVVREAAYGAREALITVELPERYSGDLEAYEMHPGMLDFATGFAMELIDGYQADDALWVPVSYERIRIYAPLERTIRSWIRLASTDANRDGFASFDVTITDARGRVLVDIANFSIKRLPKEMDFGISATPSPTEVEFEEAPKDLDPSSSQSPAERELQRTMEEGILPAEGAEMLRRVLALEGEPRVVVSSIALDALIRRAGRARADATATGQKFARPKVDSEYVAPRDEVEKTLVGFWEELLGIDAVGVQDSFFELGGHSLVAVRLFAKIKKAFLVDFPISVLFEAPTIERCAALIRDAIGDTATAAETKQTSHRTRYTHLVAMHPGEGGPKTPFFLVAGMFGNVLNLRHLAHLIGSDRPFYGLQARGLYGDQEPHRTFEEMAEAYIAELRTVQPEGPYMIGGFSGGGIAAYEMAHQLRAAGQEIALLLFLDTPLPHSAPLTARDRAMIQWQRLRTKGLSYVGEWARNRAEWEYSRVRRKFGPPPEYRPDEFHNAAIEAAFRAALPRYSVKPYPGRVVLFRPKLDRAYHLGAGRVLSSSLEWVIEDNGWGRYAREVDVHEVPGTHDSMVLEPNVRVLASKLRVCIESAEAASLEPIQRVAAE